jgi:hypothetical protein
VQQSRGAGREADDRSSGNDHASRLVATCRWRVKPTRLVSAGMGDVGPA